MRRKFLFPTCALTLVLVLSACSSGGGGGGDSGGPPANKPEPTTPQTYALVVGTVKEADGSPIDAVTVTVEGISAQTNNQGYFAIPGVPEVE